MATAIFLWRLTALVGWTDHVGLVVERGQGWLRRPRVVRARVSSGAGADRAVGYLRAAEMDAATQVGVVDLLVAETIASMGSPGRPRLSRLRRIGSEIVAGIRRWREPPEHQTFVVAVELGPSCAGQAVREGLVQILSSLRR